MKKRSLPLREVMPFMWKRLIPHRKIYFTGLILGLCNTLFMMGFPLVSELYFNMLEAGKYSFVPNLLVLTGIIFILLSIASIFGQYLNRTAISKVNRDLMIEMADHAQRLPLERAQGSHSSDLVQRISQDMKKTTSILTSIIDGIGNAVIMFLLGITYMMLIHWQVGLAILIISPTILMGSHFMRYRLQKIGLDVTEQEAVVRQCQQDILQGIETVKAFGVGEWMRERFTAERQMLNKLQLKRMWWQQAVSSTTHFIASVIEIGTVFVLGWLAITSTMTLGAIVAVFSLIYRIVGPMNAIGREWGSLQKSLGASMRTFALLRAEKEPFIDKDPNPTIDEWPDPSLSTIKKGIRWDQVDFSYREHAALGDDDVFGNEDEHRQQHEKELSLKQFDLNIEAGSFTALVGLSGAGKSTAAKLAAGLLFPQKGRVEAAGFDTSIHAEKARQTISYVPQTPYLFAGTIRDNLLLSNEFATEADLQHAITIAQADEFINSFSNGLDTDIQELGNSLSGGQRQRIAIARALVSNRPILILDEATSALDYHTERQVMDHIRKQAKKNGQTLLVIAHRLSTIMEADEIIVMNESIMEQRGTHAELISIEDGRYNQLWGMVEKN